MIPLLKQIRYPLVWLLVLLTISTRMYRITNPILDWHSFRQADTASVTREYVKQGIDLLVPKYHDLSNIQSGKDNPLGYRMVEFPVVNASIAALILVSNNFLPLELTSRLVAVIASAATTLSLFFLIKVLYGKKVAYLACFVFAVLPYAVYYGRAVLPEPFMLFFLIFSLQQFVWWLRKEKWYFFLLSAISLALALLLKPNAVFTGLVYGTLWLTHDGRHFYKRLSMLFFGIIALTPLILWRQWILQFPEGIPAYEWLLNGNGIRFRPAWLRWLGYERMIKLFMGFTAVPFFVAGFFKQNRQQLFITLSWWASIVSYFTVVATGNVQHDYYQVLVIPIYCITVAQGIVVLEKQLSKRYSVPFTYGLLSLLLILSFAFSWNFIQGYFNVNHWEYVEVGIKANEVLPENAKVIAPAFGDTSFLYQTNRVGWPIGFEIEDKIAKGATHYVTTSLDDEARMLRDKYFIVAQTEDYLILDLTKEKETSL